MTVVFTIYDTIITVAFINTGTLIAQQTALAILTFDKQCQAHFAKISLGIKPDTHTPVLVESQLRDFGFLFNALPVCLRFCYWCFSDNWLIFSILTFLILSIWRLSEIDSVVKNTFYDCLLCIYLIWNILFKRTVLKFEILRLCVLKMLCLYLLVKIVYILHFNHI